MKSFKSRPDSQFVGVADYGCRRWSV
jgi:hypothetical protein